MQTDRAGVNSPRPGLTGLYERAYWHCHISPRAIFISWGSRCPGADCDGLAALMEDGAR